MHADQEISDETLVVEVRKGDRERYAILVDRYEQKLLRYAEYVLHDEQKAIDVVQDAFIKAYRNLEGFDVRKKFSSWIYRIVHNESMNRVKKYRQEIPEIAGLEIESDENIERAFEKKEVIQKAHVCLKKIPIIYAEPLSLYYLEEKTYEEISDILRIPMGTVATRINRAKGIMKEVCQKNI